MKTAYFSIVAQHPRGLDLHIRNVRWALPNATIHIFTHGAWAFRKMDYPDVVFHETTADPWTYYPFWEWEVTPFIRDHCTEEALVFKQHDMLFHRPLQDLLSSSEILLSNEAYRSPIQREGSFQYPHIWEGGCIAPGDIVRKAITDWGIDLGSKVTSPTLLERLRAGDKVTEMQGHRIAALEKGKSLDYFCQLTLCCFLQQIPIRSVDLVCHFNPMEEIHRRFHDLYEKNYDNTFLAELGKHANAAKVVCYLLMCRAIKTTNDVNGLLRRSSRIKPLVRKIDLYAREWMSPEQLEGLRWIQKLTEGVML